jgi:hypothetical protein
MMRIVGGLMSIIGLTGVFAGLMLGSQRDFQAYALIAVVGAIWENSATRRS